MIVNRITDHLNFIKLLPNIKLDEVLQEISSLDIDSLINIWFYELLILAAYMILIRGYYNFNQNSL